MTREEAVNILENDLTGFVEGTPTFMDAFWMAVDALKQEPITVETINQYCKEHNYVLCEKGTEPKVNVVSEEVYTREYNLRKDAEMKVYKLEKAIDDIKAEIEHMACRQYEHRLTLDREEVLEVINKHMKEGDA